MRLNCILQDLFRETPLDHIWPAKMGAKNAYLAMFGIFGIIVIMPKGGGGSKFFVYIIFDMIILYVCEWPGEVLVSPVSPLPLFSPTLGLTCPSPSLQFSQFFVQNLPLPLLLLSYSNAGRKKQTILNIFGNGRNWSDRRLVGRVEWCDGGQECIKRRLLIPTVVPPTRPT